MTSPPIRIVPSEVSEFVEAKLREFPFFDPEVAIETDAKFLRGVLCDKVLAWYEHTRDATQAHDLEPQQLLHIAHAAMCVYLRIKGGK